VKRPRSAVAVRRRGHLVEIALDLRGSGDRLTADAAVDLRAAFESCADEEVWVVWLRSAGRSFCVGVDPGSEPWLALPDVDVVAALASVRAPVVASLRGRVEAEGLELALAADLRIAEPGTRFAMPQIADGSVPRMGGTQRLPRVIGVARALQMLLLGARLSARRALEWGLVTAIERSADSAARKLADELLERGPIALRFAKEAVLRAADFTLDDGARFEHDLYVLLQTTRDRAEGVRAFLEKRNPKFQGR
jgi:enoyl-CoA hydratase/carnithine racemase